MINPNHPNFGTSCSVQYSVAPHLPLGFEVKQLEWVKHGDGTHQSALTELIENHKLTDEQKENLRSCYRAYLENKARSTRGQQHDK